MLKQAYGIIGKCGILIHSDRGIQINIYILLIQWINHLIVVISTATAMTKMLIRYLFNLFNIDSSYVENDDVFKLH